MPPAIASFLPTLDRCLVTELQTAHTCCVAVALCSEVGVARLRENIPAQAQVNVLVGLDLPTPPAALDQLLTWSSEAEQVSVRVWTTADAYFHPKVYLVQQAQGWIAFVGSANCTESGWQHNEELTVRVAGAEAHGLQQEWFAARFAKGIPLTADFAAAYRTAFVAQAAANEAARNAAKAARQEWEAWLAQQQPAVQPPPSPAGAPELGRPVKPGQYFQESHYAAFDGQKPRNKDAASNRERKVVYDRLMALHHALQPHIEAIGWDLYPHYEEAHVVSSWKHGEYTEDALQAMWLNYGRSREEVKAFDARHTPMHFLRLEAILFKDHFATWCRIGKEGAIDREVFKRKMRQPPQQQAFFSLLQGLGTGYFVEVQRDKRLISRFPSATSLAEFVKRDRQGSYFVIGKDYQPNDSAIAEEEIVGTVMQDWAQLYNVYRWMRDM